MRSAASYIEEAKRIGEFHHQRAAEYSGPSMPFVHNDHQREAAAPWLSHVEVAGMVRMLMRDQLDHEFVCTLARDRILHLAQENERLRAAIAEGPDVLFNAVGGPSDTGGEVYTAEELAAGAGQVAGDIEFENMPDPKPGDDYRITIWPRGSIKDNGVLLFANDTEQPVTITGKTLRLAVEKARAETPP